MNIRAQSKLYAYIDPAIDRYQAIETEDDKDEFKKSLRTWTNLYSFLAQIMPFREAEFEKFFEEMFIDKLIERMDQNQDIFEKIIENLSFDGLVKKLMMKKVYAKLNEEGQ